MRVLPLAIAAIALSTGCGRQEAPEPAAPEAAAPPPAAVTSKATASKSVAYTCEKDLPITAVYGTDLEGNPDVALVVQGQSFNMAETVSASGARYATADGLNPGMGLVWWEKGETALLQQVPSDRIADLAAAQTIKTCELKS
jgi:membrane-bound inhibitor of C-type lysozyme